MMTGVVFFAAEACYGGDGERPPAVTEVGYAPPSNVGGGGDATNPGSPSAENGGGTGGSNPDDPLGGSSSGTSGGADTTSSGFPGTPGTTSSGGTDTTSSGFPGTPGTTSSGGSSSGFPPNDTSEVNPTGTFDGG